MNDPFYGEEIEIRIDHPRTVKEIANHMRAKMIAYQEKWDDDIFSAYERRENAITEFRAKDITVGELLK